MELFLRLLDLLCHKLRDDLRDIIGEGGRQFLPIWLREIQISLLLTFGVCLLLLFFIICLTIYLLREFGSSFSVDKHLFESLSFLFIWIGALLKTIARIKQRREAHRCHHIHLCGEHLVDRASAICKSDTVCVALMLLIVD